MLRLIRRGFAAAAIVVLVLGVCSVIAACANQCFLQVCTNGDCKCAVDTCMEGAEYNLNAKSCQCVMGRLSVQGQCLTQQAANSFCGKGSTYGPEGCKATTCPQGQALDVASGNCVAAKDVLGVSVGQNEKLECPAGSVVVIEGNAGGCVPQEQTCARDEVWNGTACVKQRGCPTGSAWNAASNSCVAYATVGSDAAVVDVAKWAQANYGPNGGDGTAGFCNQFSRTPWRFGVPEGQSATVVVMVQLNFGDGAVQSGRVTTSPSYSSTSTPVPPSGAQSVQTAAENVLLTLKQGGGKANANQAQTQVKCRVVNPGKPAVVPATGGF